MFGASSLYISEISSRVSVMLAAANTISSAGSSPDPLSSVSSAGDSPEASEAGASLEASEAGAAADVSELFSWLLHPVKEAAAANTAAVNNAAIRFFFINQSPFISWRIPPLPLLTDRVRGEGRRVCSQDFRRRPSGFRADLRSVFFPGSRLPRGTASRGG